MSDTWNQSQNHFQSLDAIDRLRDSLRDEHGLMLQARLRGSAALIQRCCMHIRVGTHGRRCSQYVLAIWRKLFTPIQAASIVAHLDAEVSLPKHYANVRLAHGRM